MNNCWCHPSNAVRTKCACGLVIKLGRTRVGDDGPPTVTCSCGRKHRKAPGGWHGTNNGGERDGGSQGCPGL